MSQIQKWNNYYIQRTWGKMGVLFTGFIGTTVHELSHLIMCIIFRHKVKRIRLFRPIQGSKDGVLGYVSHTYNPQSTYQKIGNFFIGIAPILIGTLLLHTLFKYLLPESYHYLSIQFEVIYEALSVGPIEWQALLQLLGTTLVELVKVTAQTTNWGEFDFYIFVVLMYSISTHMTLSKTDIKGALSGVVTLYIALCIGSVLLFFFTKDFNVFINIVMSINIYIGLFMMIGMIFLLLALMISMLLFGIKKALLKR